MEHIGIRRRLIVVSFFPAISCLTGGLIRRLHIRRRLIGFFFSRALRCLTGISSTLLLGETGVQCFAERAFDGGVAKAAVLPRAAEPAGDAGAFFSEFPACANLLCLQAPTIARLEAELKAERDKCVELTEKVERRSLSGNTVASSDCFVRYREQAVTTQAQLMEQAMQIARLTAEAMDESTCFSCFSAILERPLRKARNARPRQGWGFTLRLSFLGRLVQESEPAPARYSFPGRSCRLLLFFS